MEEKHNKLECYYLIEKANRDRVRETVWNKIVNVDSRVETLNEYMTAQLEATVKYNEDQDKRLVESLIKEEKGHLKYLIELKPLL